MTDCETCLGGPCNCSAPEVHQVETLSGYLLGTLTIQPDGTTQWERADDGGPDDV